MLRDDFLASPGVGRQVAFVISMMRAANAATDLHDFMQVDTGGGFSDQLVPGSATCPAYYYGQTAARGLLLVDGAATLGQGISTWQGYYPPFAPSGLPIVHPWMDAAANEIVARIQFRFALIATTILFGGHSVGGAIAILVANKLLAMNPNLMPWVHSFGSPRFCDSTFGAVVGRLTIRRWMNDDDPVPLLPPRVADVPALVFVTPPNAWIWFARYVHVRGGVELSSLGVASPAELPTLASVGQVTNLGSWLSSLDSVAGNAHSILTYWQRLGLLTASMVVPRTNTMRIAPEEPATPQTQHLVNRQEAAVQAQVDVIAERQNATPVVVPTVQAFRALRSGRIWVVAFGGQVVTIAGSKRAARALARDMNVSFRRLQSAAVVDPAGFTDQLAAYFASATDPASGFRPTMNTVIR